MSGFLGKTETVENVPGDVKGLRGGFADFLAKGGFEGLNTGTPDLEAYQKMFRDQNELTFAQAKESSGNLTGTGYGNRVGRAAQRASTEQGSFLASLMEQSKQANSNRLASVLLPFLNTGVGPPSQQYQPGFLDYAIQGAGAVAGAVGGAGGFGRGTRGNLTQSGGR